MFTVTAGTKIKFEYDLDSLFDIVSLNTLTHASKMVDAKGEDQVDNYGMVEEERSSFNQFIQEGAIKVFQKLVKMTSGITDSFKISIAGTTATKQKIEITLTGTSGEAVILHSLVGSLPLVFDNNIPDTAEGFATMYAGEYLNDGNTVLGFNANKIIFEAVTAGVPIIAPTIVNSIGDLAGTIATVTANSTSVKTVSFEIKDKASYNANYLPIIDEEINLALMNFVMKEWFSKCNLGELAKYYNENYNENIRMIIRNSISLRKPSLT